jgi:peptidoglycan hydrolase FlgJ
MAFNPRSDIVLEVLNAADPSRASLAAERLAALGGAGPPSRDFAADLDRAAASTAPTQANGLANARSLLPASAGAPDAGSRAKVDFEAMMLNGFVSEMLPKNAGALVGEGSAGEMWRSMLSEQVSRQIARSGALGLSRRLFATHELATHEAAARAGAERSQAAQMSANILSAPTASDVVNDAVVSSGRKRA